METIFLPPAVTTLSATGITPTRGWRAVDSIYASKSAGPFGWWTSIGNTPSFSIRRRDREITASRLVSSTALDRSRLTTRVETAPLKGDRRPFYRDWYDGIRVGDHLAALEGATR